VRARFIGSGNVVGRRPLGAILRETLEESRAVLAREDWNIMDYSNVIIETERLKIETICLKYVDKIYNEFNKEICRYLIPQPAKSRKEITDFINKSIDEIMKGNNIQFELINKIGNFIGVIGVYHINTKEPELGIWIKLSEQNKGYGTESLRGQFKSEVQMIF